MSISRFWGGDKRLNQDIAHLAAVLRESGEDIHMLGTALAGLEPERRVEVLAKVVDSLPPLLRGMVWGQVGLEVDGWRDVKEILTEEERRPRIVDALVERGREVHELDLTQIPARVNMDIGLYRASYRVFPRTIAQQPYENRLSFLEFTSLGNGTYEPLENVYVPRHRSDGDTYMFPRGRSMTMGMADATGQHVPRLAFGKPLWVAIEQKPTELMVHPPGQTFLSECYVGAVVLDGSPLFTHIQ